MCPNSPPQTSGGPFRSVVFGTLLLVLLHLYYCTAAQGPTDDKCVCMGEKGQQISLQKTASKYGQTLAHPIRVDFCGHLIAPQPDSQVYLACDLHYNGQPQCFSHGDGERECKPFAAKVVANTRDAVRLGLAKPRAMIDHELVMLRDFSDAERGEPEAAQSVVTLLDGGETALPDSDYSVIFELEYGTKTLTSHLAELEANGWPRGEGGVDGELRQLIARLARTLANFHKRALHLHLKSPNWMLYEGDRWKLIDLQTAIPAPTAINNGGRSFARDQNASALLQFACTSLNTDAWFVKYVLPPTERPSVYASPEHARACREALAAKRDWDKYLAMIGPKSDVWSFGIVILEMLAHTPQLQRTGLGGVDSSSSIAAEIERTEGQRQAMLLFELLRDEFTQCRKHSRKNNDVLRKHVRRHFPLIYAVLERTLQPKPDGRASLREILRMVNATDGTE